MRAVKPRKYSPSPAYRADGWFNIMSGLNTSQDRRRYTDFVAKRLTEFEAEDLWRGDDMAAKVVELPPRVSFRNGFTVQIGEGQAAEKPDGPADEKPRGFNAGVPRSDTVDPGDVRKALAKKLASLKVVTHFIGAMEFARAAGGAAVLLNVEEKGRGPNDLAKPLDLRRLIDVKNLVVLRPHECMPCRWHNADPLTENYGHPSHFRVVRDVMGGGGGVSFVCHESRLIRFFGITTSTRQQAMNNSWGDSVLIRALETIADFQTCFQAVPHLLTDFAQAVLKMQGLAELVAAGEDDVVTKRAELIALNRSVARTVLIDTQEEFERQATPVSGMAELIDRMAKRLAAALDMPVTLLMGESPAGLNASGETDVRWWYDEVAQDRELEVLPRLQRLLRLLFLCSEGPTGGVEPDNWKVKWAPMWQPTGKELAEERKLIAETDALYITNQVVTPEEVAVSRYGGDGYDTETTLDTELRERVADAHAAAVDAQEAEGEIPIASANKAQQRQQSEKDADKAAATAADQAAVLAKQKK